MILTSTLLLMALLLAPLVDGFGTYYHPTLHDVTTSSRKVSLSPHHRGFLSSTTTTTTLRAAEEYTDDEDDDDDSDDDDYEDDIDESSLGDWRKFRASLIDDERDTKDEKKGQQQQKEKKSVAKQNEELLAKQNKALAEEYRTGVWAHTIGQPEVGGLLCRMPLEAELYYGGKGYWKDKLDLMLDLECNEDNCGVALEKLDEEVDTDLMATNKVYQWFHMAELLVTAELEAITASGKIKNGILNPNDLGDNERKLLEKYLEYKQTWQEICLLLSHNPESGCSESLIINRPITGSINKQLAKILLEGNSGSGKGNFSYEFLDLLVQAFGKEAAVYMGGPDLQEEPALLIHGIPNLPGARELSPGTNIYQGGWEAAVEGVLNGDYKPLDFRFFLGRQLYDPKENPKRGALLKKVQDGAYQPVACARSLALKQCLGLPKPLWHEVLELCGGDLKALSSIELRKRADLQM